MIDGIFIKSIINEIINKIINKKINKIIQIDNYRIILQLIQNNKKKINFLISVHPIFYEIHLTKINFKNFIDTNFSKKMNFLLKNYYIIKISQFENDRIINIFFKKNNNTTLLLLKIELMGKHSNIILINNKNFKIIDSIKHINKKNNSYRIILPNNFYINPPLQNKKNPITIKKEILYKILYKYNYIYNNEYINKFFQGLNKYNINEIIFRINQTKNNKIKIWNLFFKNLIFKPIPTITINQNNFYITLFPFLTLTGNKKKFNNICELLDFLYIKIIKKEKKEFLIKKKEILKKKINSLIKIFNKYKKQKQTFFIYGQLMTTFLKQIKLKKNIKLKNYYDNNKIINIKLNLKISLIKNINFFFKKYKKLKISLNFLNSKIEIFKNKLKNINIINNKKIKFKNFNNNNNIKKILIKNIEILIGKNKEQNFFLTFKIAKKNNIWLHAKNIPGSHIIIRHNNPSKEIIKKAAILAMIFSKNKFLAKIPIDYTKIKNIKKIKNTNYKLTYKNYKTIYISEKDKKLINF